MHSTYMFVLLDHLCYWIMLSKPTLFWLTECMAYSLLSKWFYLAYLKWMDLLGTKKIEMFMQ